MLFRYTRAFLRLEYHIKELTTKNDNLASQTKEPRNRSEIHNYIHGYK